MAGKDKNHKTGLSGFLHYRENKLTDKGRNAFERELQKDPFAEEAEEGLSELNPPEVRKDLDALRKKLNSKTRKKNRIVYYRIAASFALLMVVSSLFYVFYRNKPEKLTVENLKDEIPVEIPKAPVFSESKSGQIKNIALNQVKDNIKSSEQHRNQVHAEAYKKAEVINNEVAGAGEKEDTKIGPPEKKEAENLLAAAVQPAALAKAASENVDNSGPFTAKGRIISREDYKPVSGATVVVKGTSIGTTTDAGGNYSISVPSGRKSALVASFIGMVPTEFQANRDSVNLVSLNESPIELDEIVIVGYGAKRNTSLNNTAVVSSVLPGNEDKSTSYIAPHPVNGMKDFDNYVRNNLHLPPEAKAGKIETVVVSFTVLKSGELYNIKILRSPGNSYSQEAVRLIEEGPEWKPAEEFSMKIDDEVRIMIVFR